jgi:hypothetical protein
VLGIVRTDRMNLPPRSTEAEGCMINSGNRGCCWTLWEVLDWVREGNPAVSIDRILSKLHELCEASQVRAWWPVTRAGGVLSPCATFNAIPHNYWMAIGFSRDGQRRVTGKVYGPISPRGTKVEVHFSRDDVQRELQSLADSGTNLPSRLKPFWTAVEIKIMDWLGENGCPRPRDGNQAILETWVAELLANIGYEASESSIRRHVKLCIADYRGKTKAKSGGSFDQ